MSSGGGRWKPPASAVISSRVASGWSPDRVLALTPGAAGPVAVAEPFLGLGVDADHRLSAVEEVGGGGVEVGELGVAVRKGVAFRGLDRAQQAVSQTVEQVPDSSRAGPVALRGKGRSQGYSDRVVHRNGETGSPRVCGSISSSSAGSRPGSVTVSGSRPAPRARIRRVGAGCPASSVIPRAMVLAQVPEAQPPM